MRNIFCVIYLGIVKLACNWNDIRKYTIVHAEMKNILDGFPKSAHPMGVLSSLMSALTAFNPKAVNPHDEQQM